MGVIRYLFSFKGRINRAKLWLFVLISFGVNLATSVIDKLSAGNPQADLPAGVSFILIAILLIWADIATTVKRLHDREKSGWWFLVFKVLPYVFIVSAIISIGLPLMLLAGGEQAREALHQARPNPQIPDDAWRWFFGWLSAAVVVGLWGFIELYCLPGPDGDNEYGSDPLMPPPEPEPLWCVPGKIVEGCIPRPET